MFQVVTICSLILLLVITALPGGVYGSSCNQSCQHDMELLYTQTIQAKLLQSLHLHSPLYNVTLPNLSSEQLEDYMATGEKMDPDSTNTVIAFAKPCNNDVPDCLSFHLNQQTLRYISSAKLVFNVELDFNGDVYNDVLPSKVPVVVKILRVYENGNIDSSPVTEGYLEMNTSRKWEMPLKASELYAWESDRVVGIIISTDLPDYSSEDRTRISATVSPSITPSIIVTTEQTKKRNRRHGENYCRPESTEKGCCLRDLVIDFAKLGWNFIMAPTRYNAFMCRGDCTVSHNHVLRFGHSKMIKDAQLDIGFHCCHPTEYESLKIIYTRADNEIIITRVPGMIARKCACT